MISVCVELLSGVKCGVYCGGQASLGGMYRL